MEKTASSAWWKWRTSASIWPRNADATASSPSTESRGNSAHEGVDLFHQGFQVRRADRGSFYHHTILLDITNQKSRCTFHADAPAFVHIRAHRAPGFTRFRARLKLFAVEV